MASTIPKPAELFEAVHKDNRELRERCKDTIVREMKKRAQELARGTAVYIDEPPGFHTVRDDLKQEFRAAGWDLGTQSSPKNESYVTVKALPVRSDGGDQRDCDMSSWFQR